MGGIGDRGAPRRPGEEPERGGPVVHEFEVADGLELGHQRGQLLLAETVEDLVRPAVLAVQVERLGLVGDAHQVDVLPAREREAVQHSGRRERLGTPAFEEGPRDDAERRVRRHDLAQRAAGEQQLARRVEVSVLGGQREIGQPGLLARVEPGGGDQPEDGLRDLLGPVRLLGVERVLHRRPYRRVGEDGARPGLDRAEPRQQRMDGLRMDEAQAEGFESRRFETVVRDQQAPRAPHDPPAALPAVR
nr:hypothetical protein [Actinomadura sp. J1-007]